LKSSISWEYPVVADLSSVSKLGSGDGVKRRRFGLSSSLSSSSKLLFGQRKVSVAKNHQGMIKFHQLELNTQISAKYQTVQTLNEFSIAIMIRAVLLIRL